MNEKKRSTRMLFLLAALLTGIMSFPIVIGTFRFISDDNDSSIVSGSTCATLALLACGLGALVVWFAQRPSDKDGATKAKERASLMIEYFGKLLLFSGFCFTIVALLSPLFTQAETSPTRLEDIARILAFLAMLVGAPCLAVAVCFGMVFIWVRKIS